MPNTIEETSNISMNQDPHIQERYSNPACFKRIYHPGRLYIINKTAVYILHI